jgi:WD40 repeat protein
MLKNKRNSSKTKPDKGNKKSNKSSALKHVIDNKKKKNNDLDEEIESVSDVDSVKDNKNSLKLKEKNNDNFDDDGMVASKTKKEFSKAMSADERRLLMAKTLIDTVNKKDGHEGFYDDQDKVDEEIKKSKNEYCKELSKDFINKDTYEYSWIKCHKSCITSIEYIDNNTIVTTSKDKRSFIIDLNKEKKVLVPQFTDKPLYSCAVTKDKKNIFYVGADRTIYLYNIETNKIISSLPKAHFDCITKVILDYDSDQVYTISKDNNLKIWGLNSFNNLILMETFYGHTSFIYDMDLLSPSRIVTCGNDANLHQWKIDTQSFLQYKQGETSYETTNCINKNYFFAGDYNGNIKLFDTMKKKHLTETKNFSYENDVKNNEPSPLLSMFSHKNSDLLFTGTTEGNINIYNYNFLKGNKKINFFKNMKLKENGIVSCINGNKDQLVVAYSKEAKNGRWDVDYDLQASGICIVKIFE